MNIQSTSPNLNTNRDAWLVFVLVGYVFAFFLYYIDEGNYHFEGLKRPAEWIFVTLYALVFAGCFWLAFFFLKKTNLPFFGKLLLSVTFGIGLIFLAIDFIGFLLGAS